MILMLKIQDKIKIDWSTPVTSSHDILSWIVENSMESYEQGQKNLTQNLLQELEQLFGPPNRHLKFEFPTKLWILEYQDLVFNVFTAKTKGTSIELVGDSLDGEEEKIIDFLKELHQKVNSI